MIPKKIGRYRIKAELGRGGMSTVYLAHDPHFERDVAVKLLPLELLHQPTFRRRFEREAKVVAALDHPAIVPVYDFGEEDGQPFLVMRFMEGGSLADRLKQGAISIKEAAYIISQLAPALDEVHAHGIVHRDLKPSNILFDKRNDPYISDFGTAKLTQAQTRLTETGGAIGTPAYMSPEQIQGDTELDGRSDIYALGVILFEILTGNHPYETNTPIAIAVKHIFEPVPHILDMAPDLPVECQEIISRAMAKEKAERYVTAVAFATALNKIANRLSTQSLAAVSASAPAKGQRLALLINNNAYRDDILNQLVKPAADMERLASLLRDPNIGSFDDVTVLTNQPTDIIRRHIARFFSGKKSNDLLLLYYTGHIAIGSRSRLYLTANNTEHSLLRGTAIPAAFIADEMDNSISKQQVVVLDCHFSNATDTDVPSLVGQTVNTGANFTRNGQDRAIITATDSTQYSWQKDHVRGKAAPSQFTRHFITGLETGAADLNNDGSITLNELFAFVYDRVIRNSVDEQIQMPRKWIPDHEDNYNFVIASSLHSRLRAQEPSAANGRSPQASLAQKWQQVQPRWQKPSVRWATAVVLLMMLSVIFLNLRGNATAPNQADSVVFAEVTTTEPSATAVVATETAEPATATSEATGTATIASNTATPAPTTTETAVATAAPTVAQLTTAALLSSSIFSQPDSDSQELTFVAVGEIVTVLGRATNSEWLFVQTADNISGFTFAPRYDWDGDSDALPIYHADGTTTEENDGQPGNCNPGNCPTLTIEIYPLAGTRCEVNNKYRTVYMTGNGGNGVYTYYWNNKKVAGPLVEEGFGFEVSSPDGAAVIGTGKVVSSDGQTVEQELFVGNFDCSD